MSKAYDILVNYVNPHKQTGVELQEQGLSFFQDDEDERQGRGRGRGIPGRGRGQGRDSCVPGGRIPGGRLRRGAQTDDYDEDTHHLEHEHEQVIGGAANVDNDHSERLYSIVPSTSSINSHLTSGCVAHKTTRAGQYNLTQVSVDICTAENVVLEHHALPSTWLLLDSCSTMDIVSNGNLLHDIHHVNCPVTVRCNAGRVQLTHQGYLGDYPYPVWYNPNGVANILSLSNVADNYQVTMDTKRSNGITVHTCNGFTIDFTPSPNGLYKHQLESNKEAQQMWTMLSTIKEHAMGYTKRAYKKALIAREHCNATRGSKVPGGNR
jgi:hypothetical protein